MKQLRLSEKIFFWILIRSKDLWKYGNLEMFLPFLLKIQITTHILLHIFYNTLVRPTWICMIEMHNHISNWNIRSSKTTVLRPCVRVSVRNEFYISLALPISPEIMDRFWCSRCLNDRVEVPDMIRLFAGGATTPLVVKIWTKHT